MSVSAGARRVTRKSLCAPSPGLRGNVSFFTGEEALEEVAKVDGAWNWALVGPDPEELPLSGGGNGSIEEMRSTIAERIFSFGLLRLNFGVGVFAKAKYVYIQASTLDDHPDRWVSPSDIGQHKSKCAEMKKAISSFVTTPATLNVNSFRDVTLDNVLFLFKKSSVADAAVCTEEKYEEAIVEFRRLNLVAEEENAKRKAQELIETQAQAAIGRKLPEEEDFDDAEPEPQDIVDSLEQETARQRKVAPSFKSGDNVMVRTADQEAEKEGEKKWVDDATVVETAHESGFRDGFKVEAGAIKVLYNTRKNFKWVSIPMFGRELKRSMRPKPPRRKIGNFEKQTHSTWAARWHMRYFELNRGFLMWWDSEAAVKDVADEDLPDPHGLLFLMGMRYQLSGRQFDIKTDSGGGTIYSFRASTDAEANEWVGLMTQHRDFSMEISEYIAYCNASRIDGATIAKED